MSKDRVSPAEAREILNRSPHLNLALSSVHQLITAGLLGEAIPTNPQRDESSVKRQRVTLDRSHVEQLAKTKPISQTRGPAALVIRTHPARYRTPEELAKDLDKREFIGWNTEATSQDQQQEGIRQWHEIKNPEAYINDLLVPAIAGFTLPAIYEITDYMRFNTLVSFDIKQLAHDDPRAKFYLNRIIPENTRGQSVLRINTSQ